MSKPTLNTADFTINGEEITCWSDSDGVIVYQTDRDMYVFKNNGDTFVAKFPTKLARQITGCLNNILMDESF